MVAFVCAGAYSNTHISIGKNEYNCAIVRNELKKFLCGIVSKPCRVR
jgi:hypothetical protein